MTMIDELIGQVKVETGRFDHEGAILALHIGLPVQKDNSGLIIQEFQGPEEFFGESLGPRWGDYKEDNNVRYRTYCMSFHEFTTDGYYDQDKLYEWIRKNVQVPLENFARYNFEARKATHTKFILPVK